ncbi:biotin transporter BioY [Anoxybacterium hadale]|uniref:Biotin transporter BioY n=1 Tax=Anoxybacterium hadale TaxID=3408580 RepID=A0ACD1AHN4_9FIRM|nr:biotin transporter BioY [Clostridiales bacterium]
MMKTKSISTLTLISLMTAVICILGPLSLPIPISPVPISLTNLAIYFAVVILGWKNGTISYLVYLFIGFAGMPVFSNFTAGPAKLLGPTGGYLIGFIFMALIAGFFVEKFPDRIYMYMVGMALGTYVTYILGTGWLAWQANLDLKAALFAGVIPYIPGDIIKMIIAAIFGTTIRKRIKKAGYLA